MSEQRRTKSESYQKLLKLCQDESISEQLHIVQSQMVNVVMDYCHVLKLKGIEISDEAFDFLLLLPFRAEKLRDHIEKTEGRRACVDKTYGRLGDQFIKILDIK